MATDGSALHRAPMKVFVTLLHVVAQKLWRGMPIFKFHCLPRAFGCAWASTSRDPKCTEMPIAVSDLRMQAPVQGRSGFFDRQSQTTFRDHTSSRKEHTGFITSVAPGPCDATTRLSLDCCRANRVSPEGH